MAEVGSSVHGTSAVLRELSCLADSVGPIIGNGCSQLCLVRDMKGKAWVPEEVIV